MNALIVGICLGFMGALVFGRPVIDRKELLEDILQRLDVDVAVYMADFDEEDGAPDLRLCYTTHPDSPRRLSLDAFPEDLRNHPQWQAMAAEVRAGKTIRYVVDDGHVTNTRIEWWLQPNPGNVRFPMRLVISRENLAA